MRGLKGRGLYAYVPAGEGVSFMDWETELLSDMFDGN